jgi:hypothetical protein
LRLCSEIPRLNMIQNSGKSRLEFTKYFHAPVLLSSEKANRCHGRADQRSVGELGALHNRG